MTDENLLAYKLGFLTARFDVLVDNLYGAGVDKEDFIDDFKEIKELLRSCGDLVLKYEVRNSPVDQI
jgi:uncharacterized protein YktA (UPF0223 family)